MFLVMSLLIFIAKYTIDCLKNLNIQFKHLNNLYITIVWLYTNIAIESLQNKNKLKKRVKKEEATHHSILNKILIP